MSADCCGAYRILWKPRERKKKRLSANIVAFISWRKRFYENHRACWKHLHLFNGFSILWHESGRCHTLPFFYSYFNWICYGVRLTSAFDSSFVGNSFLSSWMDRTVFSSLSMVCLHISCLFRRSSFSFCCKLQNYYYIKLHLRPHGKENTKVWITQKQEKKEESLNEKLKRSPDHRHTSTNGSLTETFWRSQMSLSIRREQCMWTHSNDGTMCTVKLPCVPLPRRSLHFFSKSSSYFSYC